MNFFRIAARIAAKIDYKSFGEPKVPNATFVKAYVDTAQRTEKEAMAASETASDRDNEAHRKCVLLFQKASKEWKNAGDHEKATKMNNKAWEHDQILRDLTGETFGIKKL